MKGLTEGRMVHVVLDEQFEENMGRHRPCVVTEVIDPVQGEIMVLFFLLLLIYLSLDEKEKTQQQKVSRLQYSNSKEAGTWHWIEASI